MPGITKYAITVNPAEDSENSSEDSKSISDAVLSEQDMRLTVSLVNSWPVEGSTTCQYQLTLENTSDTECTRWEADIPFQESFDLMGSWNGEYTVQGTTLHIRSKDYNGTVKAGESVTDVGFIVKGGGGIADR